MSKNLLTVGLHQSLQIIENQASIDAAQAAIED